MSPSSIQQKINEIRRLLPADINNARKRTVALLDNVQTWDKDEKVRAEAYHLMGLVHFYSNESTDAIKWFGREFKIREKIDDTKGASDVLNNLGAIFLQHGKLDKAKDYYQKALSFRRKINDQRGIAGALDNIGVVLYKYGRTSEALDMHFQALKINQEIGDAMRVGISLQNIGNAYFSRQDYDYALANYKESLAISEKNNDMVRAVQLMLNIGSVFIQRNKMAEAKKYFRRCYAESLATGYRQGMISSLHNLAEIEFNNGHYHACIKQYTECAQIAESTGYQSDLILAMMAIGRSWCRLKDYSQSLRYLHDALVLARKAAFKEKVSDIYKDLSEVYEQLNDYKKALEYHKKHIALRDELVNKDTTRTINEIKTRYEVEKKEKEAQLLKEKHDAVDLYARKLEVSNNELRQFAHVASHDLREPLRMVSSYMGLLERTMGDNITEDQKQFIGFAVDGARRMDTLIHDLLRLAKADADPRIERVPLSAALDDVKSNLEVLLREKHARIIAPALPAVMADRTQFMQLLQNIIGNGIKYNESRKPLITISYQADKEKGEALLSIADNGIGIPQEHREKAFRIFQRLPTARQYQGSGIGLAICKKIVDGLGGAIAIADNPGGGTVFHITLPMSLIC